MSNLMRWSGVDIADPIRRFLEGETGSWLRVEEYRDGDSMVVKAEVPGIDPGKDVDITLSGDDLRINVRHEEKTEHKDKRGYRSEFRYGTFSRNVALPGAVKEEDIRASYNDGILEVRIPVPEQQESPSRKIPITRSGEAAGTNRGTSTGESNAGGSGTDAGANI
ncbi:Hsp20/alpha crystallin family protein (plasmid) [Arthrobacter sp. FW306-05-C]|uniref:Hsp20/alpha crystallin family protein n=1 Tax=unclassified Arthrobacter TaxID=235627 RepID=UPI0009E97831|nr:MULTISPECIES: Hsp20/alpha crystallin family protein [unclassified Arthrobacter]UKA69101.1 Hsp20/alpha crystallin family protein [Arthrobacter sp. FW306-05-C]